MLLMGLWTMNAAARLRLFGIRHAFDEPGVVLILVLLGLGLTVCPLVILGLDRAGRLSPELKNDLWQRYYSWLAMIPAIAVPIVLGAFWTILAV
jgi:phosphatidate cytidylyltransferase